MLLIPAVAADGLVAGWYFLAGPSAHDAREAQTVTVFTDKTEYWAEETVRIIIRNASNQPVDIYCPVFCALGNSPTKVERSVDGGWEYFAGFCPSIEPLFGSGEYEDDFIRHSLAAGDSFELEISGFRAMGLHQDEMLRIVYYLGVEKTPVFKNLYRAVWKAISPTEQPALNADYSVRFLPIRLQ
jgi:hypothetical protein